MVNDLLMVCAPSEYNPAAIKIRSPLDEAAMAELMVENMVVPFPEPKAASTNRSTAKVVAAKHNAEIIKKTFFILFRFWMSKDSDTCRP
jgi:hypothetical protein